MGYQDLIELHYTMMIDAVERELRRMANHGLPYITHCSTTNSWNLLPFNVLPVTWFVYYCAQRDFANQLRNESLLGDDVAMLEEICMYIRGVVTVPWSVNFFDARVRNTVYRMFDKNTPNAMLRYARRYRFRLLFQWAMDDNDDTISIDHITCSSHWSVGYYCDYAWER